MAFHLTRVSQKAGLPPGSFVRIGEKRSERTNINIIDYDAESFEERQIDDPQELIHYKDRDTVSWINVEGLDDTHTIENICNGFKLHPLVIEDILNTNQRSKIEDFGNYIYIVIKMIYFEDGNTTVSSEQLSIILGNNYVLSFQEIEKDVFDAIRDRLRHSKGKLRRMGPDYLAYTLMDAIIDSYFLILETFGENIEDIEDELINSPSRKTLEKINALKKEMIMLRRSIWPLREVISNLERRESPLIHQQTAIFLRDLYDHTIQIMETIETYREMLAGMVDLYLSSVSNSMNEVMKVLTIIATIFIPLTFLAGIYGMNFENMPELHWRMGYPMVWALMILIFFSMVYYFKKKEWL